jgi:hypothetical protein
VIGVIAKRDQLAVVEEFFELFKTPWEPYRPDRQYDVVVATADDVPPVHARLLLLYGSRPKSIDASLHVVPGLRRRGMVVNGLGRRLPIYGPVLTFGSGNTAIHETAAPAGSSPSVIRIGYDLFDEVRFLLSRGQPVEHADVPALDVHIAMLRDWILNAGIPLLEIPPVPSGHRFISCLTHDIDFVGISRHRFDRTMWGFLYRSTIGAVSNLLRRRISLRRLLTLWRAALSLPFVYLGWVRDFWEPFDWYLRTERGLPATYFLIPFKRRPGERLPRHGRHRAAAYDVMDISDRAAALMAAGCEIGVHGIDAWHSVAKGREELDRVTRITGKGSAGTRSHWLLHEATTPSVLEQAGYSYDSTVGYNETIGYRAGTTQVFRPLGAQALLELPLHIQDGALFYPQRLDLTDVEAEKRCRLLIDHAERFGGVLTVLWHDRSHAPERLWGDFYSKLVETLRSSTVWFATASQAVDWFRARRRVRFIGWDGACGSPVHVSYEGHPIDPPLIVRHHDGANAEDTRWNGIGSFDVSARLPIAS